MKLKLILIFGILGVIIGCGGGDTSKTNNENRSDLEEKKLQIPTHVSVDIPSIFIKEEASTTEDFKKQLKSIVSETTIENENIRATHDQNQILIFLINSILQEIVDTCKNQEQCELSPDTIKLTFTDKIFNGLENLYTPFFFNTLNREKFLNKTISLGKIQFNKYNTNNNFQYWLIVDSSAIEKILFNLEESEELEEQIVYDFQWSENNLKFKFIITVYDTSKSFLSIQYSYQNIKPKIKQVNLLLYDRNEDSESSSTLILITNTEKKDTNITYKLDSQQIDSEKIIEKSISNQFLTRAILTENGGAYFYNQKNVLSHKLTSKLHREDIFDSNGTILNTIRCDSLEDEECDVYNPETWEENKKFSQLANIIYKDLNIEGGKLKEGQYYLLPPSFKDKEATFDNVINNQIGNFLIFKDEHQGTLDDRKYINQLDSLVIVYATDSEIKEPFLVKKESKPFEFIKEENRPDLSWIDTASF